MKSVPRWKPDGFHF